MRWLLLLLISIPASAAPLEMRYLRSENLHIANQGGAINWFDEVTLTLDLKSTGKLVAKETGKMREHNLYDSYTTEELQTWTHAWSGTWKQTGSKLSLDVTLDDRTCTHTKKPSDGKLEQLACGKVATKIHFDCTTEQVTLLTPSKVPDKREVWQCQPANSPALDRTPTPWTFGKTSCVKTLGGRGRSYEAC
jgi:hypothetical protein